MKKRHAYAVWIGVALLTITALFHFTGYFQIPSPQTGTAALSFVEASLRPLWLFASLHWLLTAAVCALAIKADRQIGRPILLSCAGVVLVDAVLLYRFIGPFVGEAVLAIAALLMILGAYQFHAGSDRKA